jgi:short-subunit dehydrogenase
VLVNNAGYSLTGPVEAVSLEAARAQFETNFFGLARLTQLVLPAMREQRWGRVVNISSMGGRFAFPGGGYYHASKHAVEGMSDALRYELRPFGVDVVLVEPGPVRTEFADTAIATISGGSRPYEEYSRRLAARYRAAYEGPESRLSITAERVADVVLAAVVARRPRSRYPVGVLARGLIGLRRVLPAPVFDSILTRSFPVPRPDPRPGPPPA